MLTINEPLIAGDKRLAKHIHLTITTGTHAALIGNNGIGKSTLLKLIHSRFDAAMLMQTITDNTTVLNFILMSHPDVYRIKQTMTEDYEVISDYIEAGGYELEQQIVLQLKKFGLTEEHLDRSIHTLSGGEQTKVALTRLLIEDKPIFIFDEPTNHMDKETKTWLISWMKQAKKTIIYASHDRSFINETAHEIIELTADGVRTFQLNYDDFRQQKEIEEQSNQLQLDKERKEKQRMKQMIQEMKEWHNKANHHAGVRDVGEQKKVAKIAKRYKTKSRQLEQKMHQFKGISKKDQRTDYSIASSPIEAKQLASFEQIGLSIEDYDIIKDATFIINRGDKIALSGRNGSGKSTLLKILVNEYQPTTGRLRINPGTKIGYFSQQLDVLNFDRTVLDEVLSLDDMTISQARTILASFRFKADRMDDIIKDLSMGEKCRLAFVMLYFSGANLLVLDEPTNYFDIEMQEIVEQMLMTYTGSIIFVSHDTYFTQQVANRQLMMTSGIIQDLDLHIEDEINEQQLADEIRDYLTLDIDPPH